MKKEKLTAAVETAKAKKRNALQTMYDALNSGQQKKIAKNDDVRKLFDLYGVGYK